MQQDFFFVRAFVCSCVSLPGNFCLCAVHFSCRNTCPLSLPIKAVLFLKLITPFIPKLTVFCSLITSSPGMEDDVALP